MAVKKRSNAKNSASTNKGGAAASTRATNGHHNNSHGSVQQHHHHQQQQNQQQQQPRPITAQEAARFIKNAGLDPSTQIVRLLAIYRFLLFCLLVYHYVRHMPHFPYKSRHIDPWLTYDQFDFLFNMSIHESTPMASFWCIVFMTFGVFWGMLCAMGGINGIPHSFRISGSIFLCCYAWKLFTFAYTYTDRHYLLLLLGIITVVSGGGSFFLIFTATEPQMTPQQQAQQRQKRRILIQQSEWGAITLRLQYAVVYMFMSLWRLHPDALMGRITRGNLVELMEQQHTQHGSSSSMIPWDAWNQKLAGQLFQILGMGGFLMHFGMFLALTVRRPKPETSRQFFLWSLLFHAFYAFMVRRIMGYSFSLLGIMGVLIFNPIGGGSKVTEDVNTSSSAFASSEVQNDIKKRIRYRPSNDEGNLLTWLKRYATGSDLARATRTQQLFTLVWIAIQVALPLRMPFVSHGNYPYTRQGYRFSWTAMLHHRETNIVHTINTETENTIHSHRHHNQNNPATTTRTVPLNLFYTMPECMDGGNMIQRRDYMPDRADATQDPRTIPLNMALPHQVQFILDWPRHMARLAGGVAIVLFRFRLGECDNEPISVYSTHFAKLNYNGAYSRIFDPTVDLADIEISRMFQPWYETLIDAVTGSHDKQYTLRYGIGSMNKDGRFIDRHREEIFATVPNAERVEFIADRASCLVARSLALWPNNMANLAFIPLQVPDGVTLQIVSRVLADPTVTQVAARDQFDSLGQPIITNMTANSRRVYAISAVSIELAAVFDGSPGSTASVPCSETTEEDVLVALMFLSSSTPS